MITCMPAILLTSRFHCTNMLLLFFTSSYIPEKLSDNVCVSPSMSMFYLVLINHLSLVTGTVTLFI